MEPSAALFELGKMFGPGAMMIAALLYYIKVRDDRQSTENLNRETRMATRLDSVQDEFSKCRRETIERSTAINERLIASVEKNSEATKELSGEIRTHFAKKRISDQ